MSTTKQRDPHREHFWRQVLQQWRKSNLAIRAFCRQRDLPESSFYAWRRTLERRDNEADHFVPVRVVPTPAAVAGAEGSIAGLELLLEGGRRLCIGPAFDGATLQRLLAVLEEDRPCS